MRSRWWERRSDAGGNGAASVAGDRGFTLVEVLVTVTIVGIAFVALLGGLGTSILGSDIHRKESVASVVAISAAERVRGDSTPFVGCATAASYVEAARDAAPATWDRSTVNITRVTYLDWNASPPTFGTACVDANGPQLITIEVKASDGRGNATVSVAKSKG